ncbi:MAG: hypothetical protein ACKO3N_16085 [Verrucomicrobiota bacterium]
MPERQPTDDQPLRPEFLDKDQAAILLKAHKRAVLQAAASGKPLPSSTLKQVLAVLTGGGGTDPTFARNQVELAKLLGVNRRTISRYLRVEGNPGSRADGRYPVVEWRKFLADVGAIEDDDEDTSRLKARLIGIQIEKLEHAVAVSRGEYWAVADVKKWCAELAGAIRKVVTQIHLIAPSVVGVSVPEAEARLKDLEDEILRQFHQLGSRLDGRMNEPGP